MRFFLISIIRLYQKTISPDHGVVRETGWFKLPTCVFYPTCSEYTIQVIEKYGVLKGLGLFLRRIIRCHPWQKNHFDPVP